MINHGNWLGRYDDDVASLKFWWKVIYQLISKPITSNELFVLSLFAVNRIFPDFFQWIYIYIYIYIF